MNPRVTERSMFAIDMAAINIQAKVTVREK
jgi:hypothetical protein